MTVAQWLFVGVTALVFLCLVAYSMAWEAPGVETRWDALREAAVILIGIALLYAAAAAVAALYMALG